MSTLKVNEIMPFDAPSVIMNGAMEINGSISATTFYGNGSNLTGISGGGGITEITYNELVNLITGGTLNVGSYYKITDFRTCYDQPDFDYNGNAITEGNYRQSEVDPIIVFAMSANTISSNVFQPSYPKDRIKYDWTFNTTEVTEGVAYGRITERIDEFNNRTDYDHRTILFKRYNSYRLDQQIDGYVQILASNGEVYGYGTHFISDLAVGDVVFIPSYNSEGKSFYKVIAINSDEFIQVEGHSYFNFNYSEDEIPGLPIWKCALDGAGISGEASNIDLFKMDGVVMSGNSVFGLGSTYFTNTYPGLFVMVAHGIDVTYFAINGDLGADGGGNMDTYEYSTTVGGNDYKAYIKRVDGAGDPSVNHIIIVNTDGTGLDHNYALNTNSDYDEIANLNTNGVTQIHYLLTGLRGGIKITDTEAQNMVESYLALADGLPIGDVLTNLNTNYQNITDNLPARNVGTPGTLYYFNDSGTNFIYDGGNDMYDQGNYLSTNLGNIAYTHTQMIVNNNLDWHQSNVLTNTGFTEIKTFEYANASDTYIGDFANYYNDLYEETFLLSNNVFGRKSSTVYCKGNNTGIGFFNNTFGGDFNYNSLGNGIYKNIFYGTLNRNSIGNDMYLNTLMYFDMYDNQIGNNFYGNTIISDFYRNEIGNYYYNNISKGSLFNNIIGNYFYENFTRANFESNQIINYFYNNKFYTNVYINKIGNSFYGNKICSSFYTNDILNEFNNNFIGDAGNLDNFEFYRNRIGNSFTNNYIRQTFQNNQIGSQFAYNTVNGNFYKNVIGNGFVNNHNIGYNIFGNHIGNSFNNNDLISDYFHDNQIGEYFNNNSISFNFNNNQIGNAFENNSLGDTQYFNWVNTNFSNLTSRSYDTFYNSLYGNGGENIGNVILGKELIMHFSRNSGTTITNTDLVIGEVYEITDYTPGGDFSNVADVISGTINTNGCVFVATGTTPINYCGTTLTELTSYDEYYKVKFTQWTQGNNGGGFSYQRTKIYPSVGSTVYFTKINYSSLRDVIIEGRLEIKRDNNGGIFNAAAEGGWSSNNSPLGTEWNSIYTQNNNGSEFTYNTFGNNTDSNAIGNGFRYNQIGHYFNNNTIDNNFGFGYSSSQGNKIGNYFYNNTIGEYFYNNTIADGFYNNQVGNYFQMNYIKINDLNSVDFIENYGNISAFTYTAVGNTASDNTYNSLVGITNGEGLGSTFDVLVSTGVVINVTLSDAGVKYNIGDTITILGSLIGGTDGIDDVVITVSAISQNPSVYENYTCDIFKRSDNVNRLSYYDENDILTIKDITK